MRYAATHCYTVSVKSLSVIIPTHKRADLLGSCIEYLERQTAKDKIEVIVVSDGHDDATAELMKKTTWGIPVKFAEIPKSQQGSARNKALEMETAPIVLFISDDILMTPGACEAHIRAHGTAKEMGRPDAAVLGYTIWDPAIEITPVMRWLDASSRIFHKAPFRQLEGAGWQCDYPAIASYGHAFLPEESQSRFTYTNHISIPADVARRHAFRTDITLYGWEDILWGAELAKDHVGIFYAPDAIAHHRHVITMQDSLKRMETLGRSLVQVTTMDASLNRMPAPWKLFGYRILGLLPTMRGAHARAFLKGVRETQKEMEKNA